MPFVVNDSLDSCPSSCLTGWCGDGERCRTAKGHDMAALLEHLADPEVGDLSDVVDLDRYPIEVVESEEDVAER